MEEKINFANIQALIYLAMLLFMFTLLDLTIISAVNCDMTRIDKSGILNSQLDSVTLTCSNNLNQSVNIYKIGSFFSTSPVLPVSISPNSSLSIQLSFSNIQGYNLGNIYSSDGTSIPVSLNLTQQEQNAVIVFPTAKVINIQQNQQKAQSIQVIVPNTYPRNIIIQSVTQNPDISLINFGDLSLGQITPGMTLNIPYTVDSKEAEVGTYSTTINILATDSLGQVQLSPVNIQVVVSASINPITNDTFTRPSCLLSATTLNFNSTYNLKCTNAVNNIDISPQYSDFIQGIKAEYSAGVYTYTFQPIKVGSSKLTTVFLYKNSPVFAPDVESFKVIPTTLNLNGNINLDADFYQDGSKVNKDNLKAGLVKFLVVDYSSRNIISDYEFYINGEKKNGSEFTIENNKIYDVRIDSAGYNTAVLNITAKNMQITFTLSPEKAVYEVGDLLNITTDLANVTILSNNFQINSPYYINTPGNVTITLRKDGYNEANKTIFVKNPITISTCSPLQAEWSKGKEVLCQLSENATWIVNLADEKSNNQIATGTSNQVSFKISNFGTVTISANNKNIFSQKIENKLVWYNPMTWDWLYWTGGVVFVVLVIFIYAKYKQGGSGQTVSYS